MMGECSAYLQTIDPTSAQKEEDFIAHPLQRYTGGRERIAFPAPHTEVVSKTSMLPPTLPSQTPELLERLHLQQLSDGHSQLLLHSETATATARLSLDELRQFFHLLLIKAPTLEWGISSHLWSL